MPITDEEYYEAAGENILEMNRAVASARDAAAVGDCGSAAIFAWNAGEYRVLANVQCKNIENDDLRKQCMFNLETQEKKARHELRDVLRRACERAGV